MKNNQLSVRLKRRLLAPLKAMRLRRRVRARGRLPEIRRRRIQTVFNAGHEPHRRVRDDSVAFRLRVAAGKIKKINRTQLRIIFPSRFRHSPVASVSSFGNLILIPDPVADDARRGIPQDYPHMRVPGEVCVRVRQKIAVLQHRLVYVHRTCRENGKKPLQKPAKRLVLD